MVGDVDGKAEVAPTVRADLMAVDIHLTTVHYPLEGDGDTFPPVTFGKSEMAPVPAYAVVDAVATTVFLLHLHDMG